MARQDVAAAVSVEGPQGVQQGHGGYGVLDVLRMLRGAELVGRRGGRVLGEVGVRGEAVVDRGEAGDVRGCKIPVLVGQEPGDGGLQAVQVHVGVAPGAAVDEACSRGWECESFGWFLSMGVRLKVFPVWNLHYPVLAVGGGTCVAVLGRKIPDAQGLEIMNLSIFMLRVYKSFSHGVQKADVKQRKTVGDFHIFGRLVGYPSS